MPLFEYKCNSCNKEFETLVMVADEEVICRFCESSNVEKKFSTFGVNSSSNNGITESSPTMAAGCCHSGCGCGN